MSVTHIPPVPVPKSSYPASYDPFRGRGTPLVIDNGSSTLRFGFSTSAEPFFGANVIAKYKERKTNYPLLLFGDGIDVETGARAQARTPWEGDVLLNFDALENSLDYAFVQLGIDSSSIEHPVIMTERMCSPLHSRSLTSELLFEQYQVPSVAYCLDSLMSLYQNNRPTKKGSPYRTDGLVISFNTASTSVIPVLGGKGILSHAKRIPWGSSQAAEYLLKLIQLKYPTFPTRVTLPQTQWILQNFCSFTPSYLDLVRKLTANGNTAFELQSITRIVQFPFAVASGAEEKTEEELAREKERRKEAGKRLQELAANKRAEKLLQREADLARLLELRDDKDRPSDETWKEKLEAEGLDSQPALDEAIKKLEGDLRRSRKKEDDSDEVAETPLFPLVDVPDAELDEDGLREKRKQRLMKAGFDARVRAKKEKEAEREEREAEERREVEERESDPTGWAQRLRNEQATLMNRIKERNRRRAALGDRKSATAQARMKTIATLAADDRVPKKKTQRKNAGDDMFGANDADWAVYRQINISAASSDEGEDLAQLGAVEAKLLQHDPLFTAHHTHAALAAQRSALVSTFRPQYEEGDVEGHTRIHLNTERWRVCEAWFSPGMAGVDSAGLAEVIHNVLARFDDHDKGRLAGNVFVTGSPSQFPELIPKLRGTIRPILPPEMRLEIRQAADPSLDAWKGMAAFANQGQLAQVSITRQNYEEWGGERIKRWWGSNWNASS